MSAQAAAFFLWLFFRFVDCVRHLLVTLSQLLLCCCEANQTHNPIKHCECSIKERQCTATLCESR